MKAKIIEGSGSNNHDQQEIDSLADSINGLLEVSGAESRSAFVALMLAASNLLEKTEIDEARAQGHDVPEGSSLSAEFSVEFEKYHVNFQMQPTGWTITNQISDAVLRHNMRCDCEKARQWRSENGIPDPDKRN